MRNAEKELQRMSIKNGGLKSGKITFFNQKDFREISKYKK